MPYTDKPHPELAKAGTVAYLLAHVQALAAEGVFTGHTSAYVVFTYLCSHPADDMPGYNAKEKVWNHYQPEVEWPHWEVSEIETDTPCVSSTVKDALDWLHEQGLITVHYLGGTQRKNKKRGRVVICSTCEKQERWRKNPKAKSYEEGMAEF